MVVFKLKEVLDKIKMSKYQLHKDTGIRPNTIADICNNNVNLINVEFIDKICTQLNLKIEDFMEIVPNPEKQDDKQ